MRRLLALLLVFCLAPTALSIEPWQDNPWFWSQDGQPLMLLGGSDDDNLFQWPREQLIPQLNRIRAAGGNVVRNTMSDRRDAGFEVYPFLKLENGKYDLAQWNPEYWDRFETFLVETKKRDIFVQIEVWDRFDYTDNRDSDPKRWESHPYNPPNNINYTVAETGLLNRYPEHPGQNKQAFFFSTPKQRNIVALLKYQRAFVNKVLDHSLRYDHILYCIDNETRAEPEWAKYWAELIRDRASQADKTVAITEMWDDWDLTAPRHRQTFDHPELYSFVDVSQNNHNSGQKHWDNFLFVRELLSQRPRPINTTKTYGADGNKFGHQDQDAIERFWRHLLAGAASIRFHRPDSGIGINDKAVACLRAARLVESSVPFWELQPAAELLADRDDNEAYAAATENHSTIVVYFPAGNGKVQLNLEEPNPSWQVRWIDIDTGKLLRQEPLQGRMLDTPGQGNLVAVLRRADRSMLPGESFELQGHAAFLMLPNPEQRSVPQPWVLYAPTLLPNYPDEHERWMHEQFLKAGIAVAGIDVGEAYGSPAGNHGLSALYAYLVDQRRFSPRPCLLGRSRGGLWVASWAAEHTGQFSGLAGIYPVFDLRSYPGLTKASASFQMDEASLQAELDHWNPIAKATALARAGVPAFLVHGVDDQVVPFTENSRALDALYHSFDNASHITVEAVPGQGHNYWPGFFRNQRLVEFVIERASGKE